MSIETFTPEQCRMGRAALRLSIENLSEISHVSLMTISRFESHKTEATVRTKLDLRRAFEERGLTFAINSAALSVVLNFKK